MEPSVAIIIKLVDQFGYLGASECYLGAIRVIQVLLQDWLGCPEASLRLQVLPAGQYEYDFSA